MVIFKSFNSTWLALDAEVNAVAVHGIAPSIFCTVQHGISILELVVTSSDECWWVSWMHGNGFQCIALVRIRSNQHTWAASVKSFKGQQFCFCGNGSQVNRNLSLVGKP
jgi:hypothetical protein